MGLIERDWNRIHWLTLQAPWQRGNAHNLLGQVTAKDLQVFQKASTDKWVQAHTRLDEDFQGADIQWNETEALSEEGGKGKGDPRRRVRWNGAHAGRRSNREKVAGRAQVHMNHGVEVGLTEGECSARKRGWWRTRPRQPTDLGLGGWWNDTSWRGEREVMCGEKWMRGALASSLGAGVVLP